MADSLSKIIGFNRSASWRTRFFQYLVYFILSVSVVVNFYFYQILSKQNIVSEVADGDTFQLEGGKRVRLLGVDAPEFDRCGGSEAKEMLKNLILGKTVKLSEETGDAYGRSQALVYLNGELINRTVLASGWARTDYRKNSQRSQLTAAFHQAQQAKLGIFSDDCRITENSDNNCVVKGNIDLASGNKVYHLPGCRYYEETILDLDRGEKFFCSEEEAKLSGFRKASSCPK